MNWANYTEKAITTSIHNNREKKLSCLLFGMLGELNELEEKIIESQSSWMKGDTTEEDTRNIKLELGDFCWYLANFAHEFGIKPERIYFSWYAYTPWKVVAALQEKSKKFYRDKNWVLDEKDIDMISEYVNILYSMVLKYCYDFSYNLSDVLSMNIEKLFKRQKEGKIGGEGDHR